MYCGGEVTQGYCLHFQTAPPRPAPLLPFSSPYLKPIKNPYRKQNNNITPVDNTLLFVT